MEEPSKEREIYEAVSAEYGIFAGVLVRRDGTRETVSLQVMKMEGSSRGVRLVVHATDEEKSLMIIADGKRLAQQALDPIDPPASG